MLYCNQTPFPLCEGEVWAQDYLGWRQWLRYVDQLCEFPSHTNCPAFHHLQYCKWQKAGQSLGTRLSLKPKLLTEVTEVVVESRRLLSCESRSRVGMERVPESGSGIIVPWNTIFTRIQVSVWLSMVLSTRSYMANSSYIWQTKPYNFQVSDSINTASY